MTGGAADRLPFRRNPFRMFACVGPWAATAYLASYVVAGSALFVASVVVLVVTGVLGLFTFGVPLLAGSALVVRGCAQVERLRSRLAAQPFGATYRQVTGTGPLAHVRTRWTDPATWRDTAYLVPLYLPLLVLDAVTLGIWLALLSGVTLPFWYWAVPNTLADGTHANGVGIGYVPNGPHGTATFGVWIGDLPTALLAAVVFAVLSLAGAYLVVLVARLHRFVARGLLGPRRDPLADAKRVLLTPGPLST